MITTTAFQERLAAPGRAPEIPESADLYGWLIGSWELDPCHNNEDVRSLGLKGEAHFEWVLEGRAVQDIWIMPRKMYGTTLRVWDPGIQSWRVTWIDPLTGRRDQLVGRRIGDHIVQEGTQADGTPIRWIFSEITPDSFRWTGEVLAPDGETWVLQGEFRAKRALLR